MIGIVLKKETTLEMVYSTKLLGGHQLLKHLRGQIVVITQIDFMI